LSAQAQPLSAPAIQVPNANVHTNLAQVHPAPGEVSAFYPTNIQVPHVHTAPASGYAAPSHNIPAPAPIVQRHQGGPPSAPVHSSKGANAPVHFSPGTGGHSAEPVQFAPPTRGSVLGKALGKAAPGSLQEQFQNAPGKRSELRKQQGTMTGKWLGPTKPQGGP